LQNRFLLEDLVTGSFLFKCCCFSEPKPTPPPQYRNAKLEQIIANTAGSTELKLFYKQLTADDMEIIVYYALRNNKVKTVAFFIISKSKEIFLITRFSLKQSR
jgi:hypothetical protein